MDLFEDVEDHSVGSFSNTSVVKRRRTSSPLGMDGSLVTPLDKILTSYNTLPDEILLKIFRGLNQFTLIKCARVCSRWKRIAYDESLWKKFDLTFLEIWDTGLDSLLRHNIKHFSITHAIVSFCNYTFVSPFPNLLHLDLSYTYIDVRTVNSLLRQCCNLEVLKLSECVIDSECCEIIASRDKLKVLNLALATGISRSGLNHILSIKTLEDLNLSRLDEITPGDLLFTVVIKRQRNLKILTINGYRSMLGTAEMLIISHLRGWLITVNMDEEVERVKLQQCLVYYDDDDE